MLAKDERVALPVTRSSSPLLRRPTCHNVDVGGKRRRGGRVVLTAMCILVACAGQVTFAGTVGAQEGVYRSANECIAAKPPLVDVYAWRCVGDSSGQWRATLSRELRPPAAGSGLFSTFLVIALLWSLVPLCVAVALARRRGESPAMAVLLTLFLGWIGLAIVYFGQSNTRRSLEGVAASAAARPPPPPGPSAESPEDRLQRLDRLLAEKLLTEAEYAEQRRRIVEAL